ncbi:MAG TPA: galactokinase [Verrucomicrobiales bacterium]|nr:galactokinase [Verrucomicrobiales bacterium]
MGSRAIARAPGRINLIGEHVDYQGGLVMPAAINRYVTAIAQPNGRSEVRLSSTESHGELVVPLGHEKPFTGDDSWANYAFGVVAKYRDAGYPTTGFDVQYESDLPLGAGLSSSAALETATALVIEGVNGLDLPQVERALLCQSAEHDWAGVPCGIMDQLAVNGGIAGHALNIDCRTLEITQAPIPRHLAAVIVDSKVKHALADGEYAKRRADCEEAAGFFGVEFLRDVTMETLDAAQKELGGRIHRRARHVISEIDRVSQFAAALEAGDTVRAGVLMAASHRSLRDDYEVTCQELDSLVELACDLGAIGARMMGGGFGGSTVNIVHSESASVFSEEIVARYREQHGGEVEAIVVSLVDGACLSKPE